MGDCLLPSAPLFVSLTKHRCNFTLTKPKPTWTPQNKPVPFIHTRNSTRVWNSRVPLNPSGAQSELAFKEENEFELKEKEGNGIGTKRDETASSGLDFGESKRDKGSEERLEDRDLVEVGESEERVGLRKRKQVVRRSSLLAKQVISIRSALSLGFVSQLWVDTTYVSCYYIVQHQLLLLLHDRLIFITNSCLL